MKKVKFCKDCRWSTPEKNSEWCNECHNIFVVFKNAWALAGNNSNGVSCSDERGKKFIFAPCGMKGKLWEKK